MRNHTRLSPSGPFIGGTIAAIASGIGPDPGIQVAAGGSATPTPLILSFDPSVVRVGQSILWNVTGEVQSAAGVDGVLVVNATLIQPNGAGAGLTPASLSQTIAIATTPWAFSYTLMGQITTEGALPAIVQCIIGASGQQINISANRIRTTALLIG